MPESIARRMMEEERRQGVQAAIKRCRDRGSKSTTVVFPAGSSHLCPFRVVTSYGNICHFDEAISCWGCALAPMLVPAACPLHRGPVVVSLGETGSGK